MHISEGVLSPAVLGAGAVLAAAGIVIGLRKLDYDRLMTVAILAAAFFVGSLIHVPIGPSSVHLILNGLLGMLLGWAAFPSIFVALMLQAILFQYGGITVLGVNTFNMAFPAVAAVLNVTEDHLNRHGTMEEYTRIKMRIFENQTAEDAAVFNDDDLKPMKVGVGVWRRCEG